MKFSTILKRKKAVSAVLSAVLMIGLSLIAAAVVFSVYGSFNTKADVSLAKGIECYDRDNDGLIDTVRVKLVNDGLNNANIEAVTVIQDGEEHLWYTLCNKIQLGDTEEFNIYAIGPSEQIEPMKIFQYEIDFGAKSYKSSGYVITVDDGSIPDEVTGILETLEPGEVPNANELDFIGYELLVERTAADAAHGKRHFPTNIAFSPNLWFMLGTFEDGNKRAKMDTDYIDLCGYGNEENFNPYLLDDREFTEGNIGYQSNNKIISYNDSGEHTGLISFNKHGNWDKQDNLDWGKRGVNYLWSYVYVTGDDALTVNMGANGADSLKVWLNGEHIISTKNKKYWYLENDVTLNPGLNLVMMKVCGGKNAHFAGQVIFYDSLLTESLASVFSVWPTLADLS